MARSTYFDRPKLRCVFQAQSRLCQRFQCGNTVNAELDAMI